MIATTTTVRMNDKEIPRNNDNSTDEMDFNTIEKNNTPTNDKPLLETTASLSTTTSTAAMNDNDNVESKNNNSNPDETAVAGK